MQNDNLLDNARELLNLLLIHVGTPSQTEDLVRDLEELRSSITLVERNKDNIMYKNKLIAIMEHICIKSIHTD